MQRVRTYKRFSIYKKSDAELKRDFEAGIISYPYEVYLPGESPAVLDAAEFECETEKECIENIDSY